MYNLPSRALHNEISYLKVAAVKMWKPFANLVLENGVEMFPRYFTHRLTQNIVMHYNKSGFQFSGI